MTYQQHTKGHRLMYSKKNSYLLTITNNIPMAWKFSKTKGHQLMYSKKCATNNKKPKYQNINNYYETNSILTTVSLRLFLSLFVWFFSQQQQTKLISLIKKQRTTKNAWIPYFDIIEAYISTIWIYCRWTILFFSFDVMMKFQSMWKCWKRFPFPRQVN